MRAHSLNEHTCDPEGKVQSLEFVMKIQTLESVTYNVAMLTSTSQGLRYGNKVTHKLEIFMQTHLKSCFSTRQLLTLIKTEWQNARKEKNNVETLHGFACHPFAGAMLIFSVSIPIYIYHTCCMSEHIHPSTSAYILISSVRVTRRKTSSLRLVYFNMLAVSI